MATQWLDEFPVNTTDTDGAIEQFDSQIVGLANGRFLVVWVHDADNVFDPPPADNEVLSIRGRLFSAEGVAIGNDFLISTGAGGDVEAPTVTPLTGGGFAAAYQRNFTSDEDIRVQIFNAAGASLRTDTIEGAGTDDSRDPVIQAFADGSYAVFYEHDAGGDGNFDMVGRIVSTAGVVGPQILVNSQSDEQSDPDAALLSDGNVVVVYSDEFFSGDLDVVYQIFTPGGAGIRTEFVNGAFTAREEFEPSVAALKGGGFVVAWTQDDVGIPGSGAQNVRYAVHSNTGAVVKSGTIASNVAIDDQNEPAVTALADGGFFIMWDDDDLSNFQGRQFDAAGNAVGGQFQLGADDFGDFQPEIGLTADGRVLYSYSGFDATTGQDIFAGIWDTRGPLIVGTGGNDVIAARRQGGTVAAGLGNDLVLGQEGIDILGGGEGADRIRGRDGADTLRGGNGDDRLFGEGQDDLLVGGLGRDRMAGGFGNDRFDFNAVNDSPDGTGRDIIDGFTVSLPGPGFLDRIDLFNIDARGGIAGNQAFTFIGGGAFTGEGQIRALQSGLNTVLHINTAGPGGAEMQITLTNFTAGNLGAEDFVL
jgi:Ca2+-binding RTX toxin-like protein